MLSTRSAAPRRSCLSIGRHELRRLLRSRVTWLASLALLVAGLVALQRGSALLQGEQRAAAAAEPALLEQVSYLRQVTAAEDDLGLLLYYLAMPLARAPEPWAGTAAGLQGVHPQVRQLRFTGLIPQLYQTELGNPGAQHAGHFDLAFVLALLAPLVLIGLSHDVRSRDEDLGLEQLVRSQPVRRSRLVALRLALRAGLVSSVALALLLLATLLLDLPVDARLATAAAALLAYLGLWAAGILALSSLGRSSAFNALALVGAWIAACVLAPGLLQVASLAAHPAQGGLELTLEQRLNMNARWDQPKAATLEPFFQRRPEWAATVVPHDRFSWPWYYAMHEQGDQHVAHRAAEYHAALEQRARWTEHFAWVLPPLALDLLFQQLAGSDLRSALKQRTSIVLYHEQLQRAVYPWIFGGQGLSAFRLEALPRHLFRTQAPPPWQPLAGLLAQLLLLASILPAVVRRLDREEAEPHAGAHAALAH